MILSTLLVLRGSGLHLQNERAQFPTFIILIQKKNPDENFLLVEQKTEVVSKKEALYIKAAYLLQS